MPEDLNLPILGKQHSEPEAPSQKMEPICPFRTKLSHILDFS